MRSRAVLALIGVCAAGAAGIALVAAADERELAFKSNVRPASVVAVVRPGEEACQRQLQASARFDEVEVPLATGPRPASPLVVTVRDERGRPLARGRLPARDDGPVRARVAPAVETGRFISVCLRNAGPRRIGIYGGPDREAPGRAWVGERPTSGDMRLVFLRSEPSSALSLVPAMFDRASLLRPEPVGPWTFWLLLAALAAGVPALLAAALRAAIEEQDDPPDPA